MGIRYYAYPLAAEFVARAREEPLDFLSADPLLDAWGPAEERPIMLYLDKCWRYLQALTQPDYGQDPRPAYWLFEGEVTFVHDGLAWIPWTRVLDPDEVAEVARDLSLLGTDDVRSLLRQPGFRSSADEYGYIAQYLADAQDFAARMAKDGSGLVYLIG
ncbi:DUF1877 family protein [Microlunatus speluncae]|uniref:DUF1877 family protein n=1 Tax=Microlunatus speluncae TaxID=2594267 RepID=UPI0012661B45|nr:DUF1877 family protein [Microlunatus speluncae]